MDGMLFNKEHSWRDYGISVAYRRLGKPEKVKIIERIPHSNTFYDFSGVYGGQEYTERKLTYGFNIIDTKMTKEKFYILITELNRWFFTPNKKIELRDDLIPNYYFMAEATSEPLDEYIYNVYGTLEVTFTANPFMIWDFEEGNDIWDTFNFLLDYAQITQFNVNGFVNTSLFNLGVTNISPLIRSSAPMTIVMRGQIFNVPVGESSSMDFYLTPNENKLLISGTGSISFHYGKELI